MSDEIKLFVHDDMIVYEISKKQEQPKIPGTSEVVGSKEMSKGQFEVFCMSEMKRWNLKLKTQYYLH